MESQNKNSGMIWILVAIVAGFFAYVMWKPATTTTKTTDIKPMGDNVTTENAPEPSSSTVSSTTEPTQAMQGDSKTANQKEFTFVASNFKYDLKEMRVKKGDTVKVILKNMEGFHDWNVDEFKAKTKILKAGETETITFVAEKVGQFEFYCSVGQHRAMGMKGNLIVE